MKSSLTYQLLLYLGGYYFACYELLELLLLLYKAILLPYPTGVLFSEVLFVLLLAVVEAARLLSGWKGNLTESAGSVGVSLALVIPSVLGVLYLLLWQSYVLRLEVVVSSIQLAVVAGQGIFGVVSLLAFSRSAL